MVFLSFYETDEIPNLSNSITALITTGHRRKEYQYKIVLSLRAQRTVSVPSRCGDFGCMEVKMKNLKLLLNFMKGNKLIYIGAILSIAFASVFSTVIPIVVKVTIDSVIGGNPVDLPSWFQGFESILQDREALFERLYIICLVLVLLTLGQGIFLFFKGKLSAVASERSGKRIREMIYDHLQHLPYNYHVNAKTGDLIQRCTSDVETIQRFVSGQLVEIGQSLISLSYVLVIMFAMDVPYTLVSVSLFPVLFGFTFKFFLNMKKVFKDADEAEGRLSATLQESLTGVRVVRAFGAQNFEMDKFDEKNKEYKGLVNKIIYLMSNFWSISDFFSMMQYGIVLLAGIYWASSGRITLGSFVAFTTYAGMLIWPIRHMGQILAFAGQAFVSLNRIQEILDQPVEEASGLELKPVIKGNIEFKDVYFEYIEGKPVINGISFNIKRGQTVAILGATGSGKSSLAHLLLRLYDYQKGSIKIDGVELNEIDKKWIRRHVGIVLQEPFLFSKTIGDNIRFGRIDAKESEILEVSSIAAIHDTITGFEKGYKTVIGERGVTLSGGQRQRLAIARTIIRNTPILIFDDSLSAVDMETDAAIRKALRQKSKNATAIIISHRITTLAEADMILVLDGGKIIQSGTHNELIHRDGLYKKVWLMQNLLEEEISS